MSGPVDSVRLADSTDEIWSLVNDALASLENHRGGVALLEDIFESADHTEIRRGLEDDVAHGRLWVARQGDEVLGVALVRHQCVCGLWVTPTARRRGVARHLLETLSAAPAHARDGWALPGDRGTKSLYESVGWKARRLTMRGE